MTKIIMRKRTARAGEVGLFPVDDEGAELIGKLPRDRDVGADVVQHRNPRHHRLYFAILKFVKEHAVNDEGESLFSNLDMDTMSDTVKLAVGYVRVYVDRNNNDRLICVPRSISWAAMDQTKFNEFFDLACKVIAERWMPAGTTPDDVRRELVLMVDGPHAIGERVA
jgi:hypothetical protein